MFNRKCKITYIAHGATIYSEENRVTDKLDYPPLNETGYVQLNKIVDFIKHRGLKTDKIYSSPALCCKQSAELIADEFNQDCEVIKDLFNRKCGALDGLTFNQVAKKYSVKNNSSFKDFFQIAPESGESISDFNNRVNDSIVSVIEQNLNKRLIIVTHPSVIQAAVANALNIPEENQYRIYIKHASATQISYFEDGASLVYADYTPY